MPLHPFNLRILAEDLVRVRRPDDRERYAASQRQARIDPNPHQIDAVIFALRRLREGGCILADEVGLGKTIEAGLVIAQRRAEGAQRILLIVPKSLIGQWQNELLNLFGIEAREDHTNFVAPGVYLLGREFAGSERGAEPLAACAPFDLVVIDEAHEIFAGLHKRYDRDGIYDETSDDALMAHRVRSFLRTSPVLLLTATPMQNSLAELWGLVQYVEPTGTLLGDITTFREVFCADDDRTLVPGQEHELQRRLGSVLQRTLRRQAQEFLDRPFTQRRCRLYEYEMSSDERSLYDDVTEYLLQPSLFAFAGSQRRLLLIGFHRRMASSIPALAASLENVAARLRRLKAGQRATLSTDDLQDLEDEEEVEVEAEEHTEPGDIGAVSQELSLVEDFVARARSLPHDAKARSFQDAIRVVLERGRDGRGSGKAVVFTESITTQEYLRRLLLDVGLGDEDVTLFRGTNDHDRAKQAHARWVEEEGRNLPPGIRPTREVAVRLALVHEFRTRSKVLVCTEAGAKGLNLQFCETIINYDLPWNPQRIEQRIGRCHRYSQQRDVTVVNFIARDNEAHQLTFEILSQKLDLFGKVLDASDHVLHEPRTDAPETAVSAVSIEFENDLRRIYSRSRTLDEVTREIAALRDKIGAKREAFEKEYERTSQIIESRFDEDVRKVFKRLREELPAGLVQLDRDISDLVEGHLRSSGTRYTRTEADGRMVFEIADDADLPAEVGDVRRFATGDARGLTNAQSLNLLHPLVRAAIAKARAWQGGSVELIADAAPELATLQEQTGVLAIALTIELNKDLKALTRTTYEGALDVGRINSYVILPVGARRLVAMVTRVVLAEEAEIRADRTMVALPAARRVMKATLIGTLDGRSFTQGVSVFPVLDNPVHLTASGDLDLIFDRKSSQSVPPSNADRPGFCITIGESAVFSGYQIHVDPDALFGKHAAILGSTGSGKSCTIASLLQSILSHPPIRRTNFVILDTNGEYRSAFQELQAGGAWSDVGTHRTLHIHSDPSRPTDRLAVPYWFLNADDFVRLFRASQGVQRPVLLEALRLARNEASEKNKAQLLREELVHELNRMWSVSGKDEKTSKDLRDLAKGLLARVEDAEFTEAWDALPVEVQKDAVKTAVKAVQDEATKHIDNNTYPKMIPADGRAKIQKAIEPIYAALTGTALGGLAGTTTVSADTPAFFHKTRFRTRHIEQVLRREESGGARARDFSGTMLLRIDRLFSDRRFDFMLGPIGGEFPNPEHGLATFLRDILGLPSCAAPAPPLSDQVAVPPGRLPFYDRQRAISGGHNLVILDLSLLAAEVLENVTALIGRVILEFLQRLGEFGGEDARGSLPVVLVLEEAQNYISQARPGQEESVSRAVYERIAREGRKFGLGLVVASQRPSELSKTVLSQCSSFIVHKLQNPEDLRYFKDIVPSVFGPLLDQLPALAPQTALVLGECVRVPALVRIREAQPIPRSRDPRFYKYWVSEHVTDVDVEAVCGQWVGKAPADEPDGNEGSS